MVKPAVFGTFEGVDIFEIALRSDAGAIAKVITWGAVIRDLQVPSPRGLQTVVLGYERFEFYVDHSPYFGATIGRVANRIAGGRFEVEGVVYNTPMNEGQLTLHGGPAGFGRRPWSVVSQDQRSVTLAIVSEDGDMGFPGRLAALCVYRLLEPATLRIELSATTDKTTPVNLAHHSYFNLDGSADILDHTMRLEADFYTPVNERLVPTGDIRSVEGTPYDFRAERPIRWDTPQGPFRYDVNYVLSGRGTLRHGATVRSPKTALTLETWTTEPGLQFYDAAKLASPVPGLGGATYGRSAGFCLEAQNFPNAVNVAHFPNCLLRPGAAYRQVTDYRFRPA